MGSFVAFALFIVLVLQLLCFGSLPLSYIQMQWAAVFSKQALLNPHNQQQTVDKVSNS